MLLAVQFYLNHPEYTKNLTATQFTVLIALAHFASRALGECYPGMKRVAEIAHQTPRSTQKHINALIGHGHVRVIEDKGQPTPRGATNLYQLGAYREHIGLKAFDDGQGLARLIQSTLMQGMKPDAARAFELRRVIETTASKHNTPLTPDVLSELAAVLNHQKFVFGNVILNPGQLSAQLETDYFRDYSTSSKPPAPLAKPAPISAQRENHSAPDELTAGRIEWGFDEKPIQPKTTSDEGYTLPPDYSGGSFTLDAASERFMSILDDVSGMSPQREKPAPPDEDYDFSDDEIPF